ncbi:hypothetical protein ABBQ38_014821 [Trebouxia sp. C0009 RCD-2024]
MLASKDDVQQQSEEALAFARYYSVKSTKEEAKTANMRHLVWERVPGVTVKGKARCTGPSYAAIAADSTAKGSAFVLISTCGLKLHQKTCCSMMCWACGQTHTACHISSMGCISKRSNSGVSSWSSISSNLSRGLVRVHKNVSLTFNEPQSHMLQIMVSWGCSY